MLFRFYLTLAMITLQFFACNLHLISDQSPFTTTFPSTGSSPHPDKVPPKIIPKLPMKSQLPEKSLLPKMEKPFGMPGVVGFQNDKWVGTDYLGYVSDHIGIDVEILKSDSIKNVISTNDLTAIASDILKKDNLIPRVEVLEGPPLPFLHILIIVYPVESDRYVVFGTCRLFEQIQVMRKNFSPAGYWQGITWENQDMNLTSTDQLDAQIKSVVDKLVSAFVVRYRIYNPQKDESNLKQ